MIEFSAKTTPSDKHRGSCLILGVYESRRLTPQAEAVNALSDNHLSEHLKTGDMDGKIGQSSLLYKVPNIPAERVLLIGCGKERELNEAGFKKIITALTGVLQNTGITDAISQLTDLHIKARDLHWHIRTTIETLNYANYRFDAFKSEKDTIHRPFKKLTFFAWRTPPPPKASGSNLYDWDFQIIRRD